MSHRIDLGGAQLCEEAIAAAAEVLRSGWPGAGPVAESFERAFSSFIGAEHAVAVNSGTAALHLAVKLLELNAGSEVITTANTFIATNQVLLYENLVPVFADIEPNTGNICVKSIKNSISDKTAAIMIVHYAGYPCDLDAVYALADLHGLPVIEDCAHACGAAYKGQKVGSYPGLQAFSFQATKNLSAVDGGLLFARSADEAARARQLRWMGISTSTLERTAQQKSTNMYDVLELGYRYAMSDLNAAIALAQLGRLEAGNARRRAIAARYSDAFSSVTGVTTLVHSPERESSNHLYPLLCEHRNELASLLRFQEIITGAHYQRNDAYSMFNSTELPELQRFSDQVLTLPIHLGLSDADVDRVVDKVAEAVLHLGKTRAV